MTFQRAVAEVRLEVKIQRVQKGEKGEKLEHMM